MKMKSKTMMQPTAAKEISLTVWRMYNKEKTGFFFVRGIVTPGYPQKKKKEVNPFS